MTSQAAGPLARRRRLGAAVVVIAITAVALAAFEPPPAQAAPVSSSLVSAGNPCPEAGTTTTTTEPGDPECDDDEYPLRGPMVPEYGLSAPPVPAFPFEIPPGLLIGGGAAGAGAGPAGLCVTATAGGCAISGAILAGVYFGTTKVLNMICAPDSSCPLRREYAEPEAVLIDNIVQTEWRFCADDPGQSEFAAIEAISPGSICSLIAVGQYVEAKPSWRLRDCPRNAGCAESTGQAGSNTRNYGDGSPGRCAANGSTLGNTCTVTPFPLDNNGRATSHIVISRSANQQGTGCPGVSYPACGLLPSDMVSIWTYGGGYGGELARIPASAGLRAHGLQRRLVTTVECKNLDSNETTNKSRAGEWHFDDAPQEYYPSVVPDCGGNDWATTRYKVELETLGQPTETVIDVVFPDTGVIPRGCWDSRDCTPERNEDGDCTMGGEVVQEHLCTHREESPNDGDVVTRIDPVPPTQPNPQPQPVPDPAKQPQCVTLCLPNPLPTTTAIPSSTPETSAATTMATTTTTPSATTTTEPSCCFGPPDPDDADDGDGRGNECFPHGWGLLNPVDWVVKPVKCVLVWAFYPKTSMQTRVNRVKGELDDSGVGAALDGAGYIVEGYGDGVAAAGTTGCSGPELVFTIQGESQEYRPLNACSQPQKGYADWVRRISTAMIVVSGFFVIVSAIGSPFGVSGTWDRKEETGKYAR